MRTQAELDALPDGVPAYCIQGDFIVRGPRDIYSGQGAFVQHLDPEPTS